MKCQALGCGFKIPNGIPLCAMCQSYIPDSMVLKVKTGSAKALKEAKQKIYDAQQPSKAVKKLMKESWAREQKVGMRDYLNRFDRNGEFR